MLSKTSLATAMIAVAAIAPIACSVRVEKARPIAPSAVIAAATYSVTKASRTRLSARETVVPDSRVTGPTGKRASPVMTATTVTRVVAQSAKIAVTRYLMASNRVRPAGTVSRYRSVPYPASPATESPATTLTTSGRTRVSRTVSAAKLRNRPLPVTWPKNGGPPPLSCGEPASRSATPMMTGTTATTTRSTWLRRRRNTRPTSERARRSHARAGAGTRAWPAWADPTEPPGNWASAVDIEPLPGQRHEKVLKAGAG